MDVCVLPSGDLLLCTDHGQILRSSDDGSSWDTLQSGVSTSLNRMAPLSDNGVVAVGDGGVILTVTDGRCQQQSSGTSADIEDIARSADGRLYAVSGDGEILTSTDGTSWQRRLSGTKHHLFGLCIKPDGKLVCVGEDGIVVQA
jgi:photosystem II stability/assembly factor-like uncharacterized protein